MPDRSELSVSRRTPVPLLPLPDLVLFPGVLQPLHIFEARYRQLVRDVLDSSGLLVLGTVLGATSDELRGAAEVETIAGLGRLEQYQKLEDGRFIILLRGEARVRIHEVASEQLYRKVRVQPLVDSEKTVERAESYRDTLRHAVLERASDKVSLPDDISVSALTDLLLLHLELSPPDLHALFSNVILDERARDTLVAHQATE